MKSVLKRTAVTFAAMLPLSPIHAARAEGGAAVFGAPVAWTAAASSAPSGAPASRSAAEHPSIAGARIYSKNGRIVCDMASRGLFSEKITGTIRSGLPAVVELFFHLLEAGGRAVAGGVVSWYLEYDVWDDRYTVTSGDSTLFFAGMESMQAMMENLEGISLIPLDRTRAGESYRFRMRIAVNPLKGADRKKIEGWVDRNVRGGGEDSGREQVLSVNDLISYFFRRGKDAPDMSEWYFSQPFTASTLAPKAGSGPNGAGRGPSPPSFTRAPAGATGIPCGPERGENRCR